MGSKFKLLKRGFAKNILLIPGWASDFRIFSKLDLDYNYILPVELNLADFEDSLVVFLDKNSIQSLSILGWSQGAYLAADFSVKYPEKIEELFLLNIRDKYERKALDNIVLKLKKNKKAYLYKFYLSCFSKRDSVALTWFRDNLLNDYLNNLELNNLLAGLDYFREARIKTEGLSGIKKIKIFHGTEDRVAPFEEGQSVAANLAQARFIPLANIGHVSFLNPDFKAKLYE